MSGLAITIDGRRLVFTPGQVTVIGRDATRCNVVVDDPRVSREHVTFHHDDAAGWMLTDAGSSAGTFLGGEQISRAALDRRVELRLGDPRTGPLVIVEPAGGGAPADTGRPQATDFGATLLPGGAVVTPQGNGPGYPQSGHPEGGYSQGGYAPVRRPGPAPAQTMGLALMIVGFVVIGLGTIAAFFAFGLEFVNAAAKTSEFFVTLAGALALGGTAVAAGTYLRSHPRA